MDGNPAGGRRESSYQVVGFADADLGLAVAARNSLRILSARDAQVAFVPVEARRPVPIGRRVREAFRRRAPGVGERLHPPVAAGAGVNLFHLNPIEIAFSHGQWSGLVPHSASNACVPFWELPVVPHSWGPVLRAMDAVLAPSRFVQAACAAAVPDGRIIHYPQAVFLPGGVRPDREAWGLRACRTAFVVAFDYRSDVDRKNPGAAIEAFQAAFPGDDRVALVVKASPCRDPALAGRAEELRARIAGDRRIRVVDRVLRYDEVLGLYASCDVLVSLHRSEGLGLHLMEAMSVGTAVVATGWSGNSDFMTPHNSIPIPFRLVPVQTTHPTYRAEAGRHGQVWADADVGEATRALRLLDADPDRRKAIAVAAIQDMEGRREAQLTGQSFDRLEEALAGSRPRRGALVRALSLARAGVLCREALSGLFPRSGAPRSPSVL
jgi:glycosyltransferase involved in cell wall biosynthesis